MDNIPFLLSPMEPYKAWHTWIHTVRLIVFCSPGIRKISRLHICKYGLAFSYLIISTLFAGLWSVLRTINFHFSIFKNMSLFAQFLFEILIPLPNHGRLYRDVHGLIDKYWRFHLIASYGDRQQHGRITKIGHNWVKT